MRIAIDGRCFTAKPTGVANFALNALNSLSQHTGLSIFILAHKEIDKDIYNRIVKRNNIYFIIKPNAIIKNNGTIWFFLMLHRVVKKIDADVYWGPGQVIPFFLPSKVKTLLTVHDFVFKKFKKTMAFRTRLENTLLTPQSIKHADFLWCNSNYTRNELLTFYPQIKKEKIFVGCGIDINIFYQKEFSVEEKQSLLMKFNISGPTLLFVGTMEPRKNLKYLFSLMPELADYGVELLVVGNQGWGKNYVEVNDFPESFPWKIIKFVGFVSLKELVDLYNLCDVLVCPSLNEGFGLPLLEAMSCGCPVVAAHNSAMIEVVDDLGLTVKGWDKQKWVSAILEVINNRTKYSSKLAIKRKAYNWDIVIENLVSFLNNG